MNRIEIATPSSLDGLKIVERDPPRAGRGEILVKIAASSLNFHDYLVATGALPVAAGRVPMSDGAGEVIEVGEGVHGFAPADHVIGTFFTDWLDGPPTADRTARMRGDQVDGFATDMVALPESDFTHAPAGFSHVEAATLPCAAVTAWRALLVEGHVTPGQTVLVQGSGGVAVFAIQFAKIAGAAVIAVTSSDAKAAQLRAIGADDVINRAAIPAWGKEARRLSAGGVDHVIEVAGGDLTQTLQATRVGGAVHLVGALSRQPIQFASWLGITGNLRIGGLTVGSRRHQQDMVRAIEIGKLKPVIDRVFPLAGLADAFRHQASHAHVGKICITL
jgi:NADPH:quinone reductase-like Zn-dependent oxidoreductase